MSTATDIVLIYPPWPVLDDRAILQNSLPPLGILSIASYMEELGYSVAVIDVHGEKLEEDQFLARLKKLNPKFIGISVLTNMAIPALKIAKIAGDQHPDATIIAGGVHAEAMPERMLRCSAIDAVVRGDGEEAMREIVEGKPFAEIDGLTYRAEDNSIKHNKARAINMDLDKYPFPAYHLVDLDNYFPAAGSYRDLPATNMLMTRGCPGKCAFCNSARTVLRTRDAERVVEQVKLLRNTYGIRQIQFYDDTFTVMKKNVLKFCDLLVKEKVDISWTAYVRGDCFSADMAAAMKKAGCHQVLMGIETGNDDIAARIGKPIDKAQYHKAVQIAHDVGMEVRGSFIIGNMDETWETMEDTLQFAIDLDLDLFQLSISTPYPGSALYNEGAERGWLKHCDWYSYGQGEVLISQPQLPDEDIYKFERYAFRKFYMRPKMILRQLKRMVNLRQLRDNFLAAKILLLGLHKKDEDYSWDCWKNLNEEDFLDLPEQGEQKLRLTYELRQGKEFVAGE